MYNPPEKLIYTGFLYKQVDIKEFYVNIENFCVFLEKYIIEEIYDNTGYLMHHKLTDRFGKVDTFYIHPSLLGDFRTEKEMKDSIFEVVWKEKCDQLLLEKRMLILEKLKL